jgi:UPF0176 protein
MHRAMFTVAAFYRFADFARPGALRKPLLDLGRAQGLRGSILLAREGINGTVAGPAPGIAALIAHLRTLPGCADLDWKESRAETMPFGRLKVRLKREIVTMGRPEVSPAGGVGAYVPPADWNALISAPDVAVIDTRNAYEVAIGTFQGAVDPKTQAFGEFPDWWEAHRDRFAGKRIAMFCTGGIRCEKATAFLRREGVQEVYHLQGGILKYLEEIPADQSLWRGGCFVFDQRVALGHGLQPTGHSLCHACRRPLDDTDRARPEFEEGVACHRCAATLTGAQRTRFRERQRQIARARMRGEAHLGPRVGS